MGAGSDGGVRTFRWGGGGELFLDAPTVTTCGGVVVGRYGGRTAAGADKNEDGALVWAADDGRWEFAAVIDAHFSAQAAALILDTLTAERDPLLAALDRPIGEAFAAVQARLVGAFASAEVRERCRAVVGEASCFFAARKGDYLWWLAIGDCVGYLLHPALARFGEVALNQRRFYEWVGHVNTFDLPVPCFTSGVRQLPPGLSRIVLLTDGVLECPGVAYSDPRWLYDTFYGAQPAAAGPEVIARAVDGVLGDVHRHGGRDSATIVAWSHERGA